MNLQLEFSMPVRVVSEANTRDHWTKKFKRKQRQQLETHVQWKRAARRGKVPLPCVVRLTRIGSRRLDDDNLAGAFKACRDQIAREIGVDDGDDRIKFEYAQEAVGKRVYGVKVEVYASDT